MSISSHVPPGFRFHPTDEELVDYYLRKKVASRRIDLNVIKDVDLYKIEPWDLEEKCRIGAEEQNEYYFFSHKDKKYPTGTRTNRATAAGFWKATGRDKPIYTKHMLVGMRKTLVYYKGRAPNGQKSDWIMHEYRLETNENAPPQEEGWVVCRVFKKRAPTSRKDADHESPCWYDEDVSFMQGLNSPMKMMIPHRGMPVFDPQLQFPFKRELKLNYNHVPNHDILQQMTQLESPNKIPNLVIHGNTLVQVPFLVSQDNEADNNQGDRSVQIALDFNKNDISDEQSAEQVTDWRVLDKFVASQLSHDVSKEQDYNAESADVLQVSEKQEAVGDYASTSTSSCQVDMWK
ncbi:hypothetical protein LUZ63_009602 [Rhynchospora breviuscula]|uniref:NAC domain-containing protein n=1 Tax=Rhynchospora breviuscula TaxID=2022672 RepID=A0A9Q0CFC4_9POAL|nr:hypothetical protein LUZ63_009602 [Rhynchospora breviuscula]